jgi:hypothetical protein
LAILTWTAVGTLMAVRKPYPGAFEPDCGLRKDRFAW